MQTVTMTLQVPVDLKDAFIQAVNEAQKPASSVMLDLMREFISEAEEKKTPLYRAGEALIAGNADEALELLKDVPMPPELAFGFKDAFGVEFLLNGEFNLTEAEEKYGKDWLRK